MPAGAADQSQALFAGASGASGAPVWDSLMLLGLVSVGCVGIVRGLIQRNHLDVIELRFFRAELVSLLVSTLTMGLVVAAAAIRNQDAPSG